MFGLFRKKSSQRDDEIREYHLAICKQWEPHLLPCPFCGAVAGMGVTWGVWDYFVSCSNHDCEISTEPETEPEWAAEKWNRRYSPQVQFSGTSVTSRPSERDLTDVVD